MASEFFDQTLIEADFSAVDLQGATFERCRFERCNFSGAQLRSAVVEDCVFESCDFSNASFSNTRFQESVFNSCKLIGINWTQTESIRGLELNECNVSFCNFMGLKHKKLKVTGCRALDVDFRQADLTEADFKGTDLAGALFSQTVLAKADFRHALNYVIDPTLNRVKDARFTLPEAIGLLTGLGIKLD